MQYPKHLIEVPLRACVAVPVRHRRAYVGQQHAAVCDKLLHSRCRLDLQRLRKRQDQQPHAILLKHTARYLLLGYGAVLIAEQLQYAGEQPELA